ncbi:MAG TPA: HAD family phosphatase [Solirubrobacteraceae bacterium]|nr:HAD family phosphatase [Solirubrobacteraceae bacterium]
MAGLRALVCDFGGVLTTPVSGMVAPLLESTGATMQQVASALEAATARLGANPLVELERGRISEAVFLEEVGAELGAQVGRPLSLEGMGERMFASLEPNVEMLELVRRVRERGLQTAICTNNVREWSERWRAMIPVSELFDVVVDSAFVGVRKPQPEIYELTLERLGVEPAGALMVDDSDANCRGAARVGMRTVHFRDTEQAIREIEAALGEAVR